MPAEQAVHVYDHILAVDKREQTGLTHCGLRALGSLRQEKAYKDFGHDVVCDLGCVLLTYVAYASVLRGRQGWRMDGCEEISALVSWSRVIYVFKHNLHCLHHTISLYAQDNTDSVLEAALGFTCDFAKPGGFIGKEAIEKEKATPGNAKRRLMQVWHNSNRIE